MKKFDDNTRILFEMKLSYLLAIRKILREASPRLRKTQLSSGEEPRSEEENAYHLALAEIPGEARSIAKSLCKIAFGKFVKGKEDREDGITIDKILESQILTLESYNLIETHLKAEEQHKAVRVLSEGSGLSNLECRNLVSLHWNTKFRGRANGMKFNF
jgi:hypothetical protein